MKKKILIGIIAIIMCFICFSMWILSGIGNTYYYVQIDNSKIEQINSSGGVIDFNGGMSYSYSLPAYSENGNKKNITFGTSRELKEGAFIELTVVPIRGVIEWKEVQYNEMPINIQSYYTVLENDTE
ncbi:MAG: YxeA family protein [Firmicutes bacterium]|jgi:uncharacterized protein (TIGR01655 family)|nr:YxeA family protein [Bacillota bacterium]